MRCKWTQFIKHRVKRSDDNSALAHDPTKAVKFNMWLDSIVVESMKECRNVLCI